MLSGARIVIVAAAVGACIGAALALALTKRVTAGEEAVAARTLTPSAAAITAPAHETHFFVDASPPPKKGQVAAKKRSYESIPASQAYRLLGCVLSMDFSRDEYRYATSPQSDCGTPKPRLQFGRFCR